jgi:hypothetical protein
LHSHAATAALTVAGARGAAIDRQHGERAAEELGEREAAQARADGRGLGVLPPVHEDEEQRAAAQRLHRAEEHVGHDQRDDADGEPLAEQAQDAEGAAEVEDRLRAALRAEHPAARVGHDDEHARHEVAERQRQVRAPVEEHLGITRRLDGELLGRERHLHGAVDGEDDARHDEEGEEDQVVRGHVGETFVSLCGCLSPRTMCAPFSSGVPEHSGGS